MNVLFWFVIFEVIAILVVGFLIVLEFLKPVRATIRIIREGQIIRLLRVSGKYIYDKRTNRKFIWFYGIRRKEPLDTFSKDCISTIGKYFPKDHLDLWQNTTDGTLHPINMQVDNKLLSMNIRPVLEAALLEHEKIEVDNKEKRGMLAENKVLIAVISMGIIFCLMFAVGGTMITNHQLKLTEAVASTTKDINTETVKELQKTNTVLSMLASDIMNKNLNNTVIISGGK